MPWVRHLPGDSRRFQQEHRGGFTYQTLGCVRGGACPQHEHGRPCAFPGKTLRAVRQALAAAELISNL
jgi:hypothetical protein